MIGATNALWVCNIAHTATLMAPSERTEQVVQVLGAVSLFAISLLLLIDPAAVTTSCLQFLEVLSAKRAEEDEFAMDRAKRIDCMERYLAGFNRQQGVGYTIYGFVVTREVS